MELEVKEVIKLADGVHSGHITKVEYRTQPYEYTDVSVRPDGEDFELKYGAPTNISANSKLGRLLKAFGADISVGSKIDPEKVLKGDVTFQTIVKKTDTGEFVNIVEDSLTPKK